MDVRTPADFDGAFEAAAENADALITPAESLTGSQRPRIFEFAARNRLPAIYDSTDWVEQGGLMSYGANLGEFFRQAAIYVDKILKGANPADLPVEQPAVLEMVVNLKTARSLGLAIPPAFLARATDVIQ